MPKFPPQLLTVEEIANLFCDTVHNIQGYVRRDAIPYVVIPDGIVIPLGGFWIAASELYDLDLELHSFYDADL